MSWRMLANPPTENVAITYSAPDSASSMSVVARAESGDPAALGHVLDDLERGRQRLGVEVVEDHLGVGQSGRVGEVHHQLRSPVRTSSTDQCDLRRHRRRRYPRRRARRVGGRCRPVQAGSVQLPYSAAMSETRERTVEQMRGRGLSPIRSTLARAAAAVPRPCSANAVEARGVAHAMFATGNSQLEFVDTLVTSTHHDVSWGDVVVFHMDEYVGVGPDHPAGFQRWIRERISDRVHPRRSPLHRRAGRPRCRVPALRRAPAATIRSTSVASASARTGISPSTTLPSPTSTTPST